MTEKVKESNKQYGTNCIGNVIRILDDRTIVVNVGKSILNVNSTIHIYTIEKNLYDIDGSELGPFELIKDTLQVVQTEQKYSVCKKPETKTTTIALSPIFERFEYAPLDVKNDDIDPLRPTDLTIKIGDPIKLA